MTGIPILMLPKWITMPVRVVNGALELLDGYRLTAQEAKDREAFYAVYQPKNRRYRVKAKSQPITCEHSD